MLAGDFNELESAVIDWCKRAYRNDALTAQIESAHFQKREWTVVGYYITLAVSREVEPLSLDDFGGHWPIDGPYLVSEDIDLGGGALLWGTPDGYLQCIEMYAFGDFFGKEITNFQLLTEEQLNRLY